MAIFASKHAKMSDQIKDHVEQQMSDWAADFVSQMATRVRRRKMIGTGELSKSFKYELNKEATRQAIELLVAFKQEGRFVEMKRLGGVWGDNAASNLAAWVERKGVDKFRAKYIQNRLDKGYLKKAEHAPKTPGALANSIAWGIFFNRVAKKKRRKQWYNKPKQAGVSLLYNQIAASIPTIVSDEIQKSLKQ